MQSDNFFQSFLHGFETWYLNFREEYELQVLKEAVIRKPFGPTNPKPTKNLIIYKSHKHF